MLIKTVEQTALPGSGIKVITNIITLWILTSFISQDK